MYLYNSLNSRYLTVIETVSGLGEETRLINKCKKNNKLTNGFGLPPSFVKQKCLSSLLIKAIIFTGNSFAWKNHFVKWCIIFIHEWNVKQWEMPLAELCSAELQTLEKSHCVATQISHINATNWYDQHLSKVFAWMPKTAIMGMSQRCD